MKFPAIPKNPALKHAVHWLLSPFAWLLAALFIIEEAIWDWTARIMARLGALRAIHTVELYIAALHPGLALIAFLLPGTILIPAKLFGLHAIASGHWLLGSSIFILAKIAGLALFSRIFNLTRPALMQIDRFARFYAAVMHYRNNVHRYLDQWQSYQSFKRGLSFLILALKARLWAWLPNSTTRRKPAEQTKAATVRRAARKKRGCKPYS